MFSNPYSRTKRGVKRLDEIIRVLARYGLADYLGTTSPLFIRRRFVTADGQPVADLPMPVRLRLALTELGTTFIKLGQMLSTRADLVGPELAAELSSLQADTPADPPDAVRAIVEQELGRPVEEIFARFDFWALASASVGQVHLATLPSGEEVVVKVQHAGVQERVSSDLDILNTLASMAERNSRDLAQYRPTLLAAEFSRSLLRELDFTVELRNLERFVHNFEDAPTVHMPQAYAEFSTRRILVMEKLDGYSLSNVDRMRADGIDTALFADNFAHMMMDMIFQDGFYHADPHPGNVFVLPGGRIGLLDCGKVGRVDERTQDDFVNIVQSFLIGDADQLTDELLRLCQVPSNLDRDTYRQDVSDFIAEYSDMGPGNLDISAVFNDMFALIRRHKLVVPARVSMLLLVVVQLEGTARLLDPEFNLTERLGRYRQTLVQRRFSPQRLGRQALRSYQDWNRLIKALPRELVDVLERTRKGDLEVKINDLGRDRQTNRLTYGIVNASLFLGSALLLAMKMPPLLFGVSVLGALGLAFSFLLVLNLARALWRSGGLS